MVLALVSSFASSFASSLASCVLLGAATSCVPPQHPVYRDPVAGFAESDKLWFHAWRAALAGTTPAYAAESVRLALVWSQDGGLAQRLSRIVPASEVDARYDQALRILRRVQPDAPSVLYAGARWIWERRRNAVAAMPAACRAAALAPAESTYLELCGEMRLASGDIAAGTESLALALAAAPTAFDQCRILAKVRALVPDPEVALPHVPLRAASKECEELRRQAHLEAERRRQLAERSCLEGCHSNLAACVAAPRGQDCPRLHIACTTDCRRFYAPPVATARPAPPAPSSPPAPPPSSPAPPPSSSAPPLAPPR